MENLTQNDITKLFNDIAKNYDYINNIISFFTHKNIRKLAIKELNIKNHSKVLDLCCGSGDFGSFIKNSEIIGVDISLNMIELAKKKYPKNRYYVLDATNLNFNNKTFDYIIMGFGLRNIINRKKAIKEITRTIKENGYFLHLDFCPKGIITKIYNKIILIILKLFIKNIKPYEYLVYSKNNFLEPKEIIKTFEKENFKLIKRKDLLFGIISFQIMQKIAM